MDIVSSEMDLEKEVKVKQTIDIIKKKAAALKKLEEGILDVTTDNSLLEEMVNERMTLKIYCKKQLTILAKYTEKLEKKVQLKYEDKSRNVKLPKLGIKKFSGEPTAWMTFIDLFEATVDRSTNLSEVEKFNYLLSYLEKDALQTISGMPITNANYKKTLELLRNRFGNPQKIISAHMNELLKLKRIASDRHVKAIRLFYHDIENHVRSLDGLGITISTGYYRETTTLIKTNYRSKY